MKMIKLLGNNGNYTMQKWTLEVQQIEDTIQI